MIVRILLFPLTLLYGTVIVIRNFLYKSGILTRTKFDFPIICVGNISAGGTGKTPHIEWLIQQLQHEFKIAVLSRGYKRKTVGYVLSDAGSTPETIGDEPYQIKQKFPDIHLAVSENRVLGVPSLLGDCADTQVILMDDGFQHLPIQPGYSIILTDYNHLFYNDWLLPSGRLREFRSAYKRANCIVVSKCPTTLTDSDKQRIRSQIQPLPNQTVLFSSLAYDSLKPLSGIETTIDSSMQVLAFSGIAHNTHFLAELKRQFKSVQAITLSDHSNYSAKELRDIAERFNNIQSASKIIITTEKDAVKLKSEEAVSFLGELPVYVLPVSVQFEENEASELLTNLRGYIYQTLAEQ
jgi:tetraacyldisaccharide 4'-kinase